MRVRRTVGEKGQVTIPKDIRERLGMLPGTDVFFDVEDEEVVVETGPLEKDIDQYRKEEVEERVSA